ncbi:thiamine pyrophosphate-dependent enzyme [uncultured Desulfosarcina sp.]|uniref:thiamine pyrophosphate-dependent enzyme n=1 Tax=uncultured Desulfosarcina sp. TaxID=218289 RepID=UPI0029C7AF73|nr:thiamine pyrophosphate-dependent enzyme [uncultured Desulfosarcina sp.]
MSSLINTSRPPVFCPGCSHERIVHTLDKAFEQMGLDGSQVVIVSDIGCSGLFDTFFNTHAFHGLHGRALTYATGLKMARPDLKVIVTMGDGGLGIGGAHVLSTCRRNIDLTLLILNNFNYGMTGGQCSSTTPREAVVGSGFLNQLEKPVDICQVTAAAGAAFVTRTSSYAPDLVDQMVAAIRFDGFSVIDMWGMCPGRYTKRNKITPKSIEADLAGLPPFRGPVMDNQRREYGSAYREVAAQLPTPPRPANIEAQFQPPASGRQEVLILGSAGQRIVTAGEIFCLAGMTGGWYATLKNDYPITVLRGHSVSEMVLSPQPVDYTGIERPKVVVALADEGVGRRKKMLARLDSDTLIIKAAGVTLPESAATVQEVDFKAQKIKSQDWALASLALLAKKNRVISMEMFKAALAIRFKKAILEAAMVLVDHVSE